MNFFSDFFKQSRTLISFYQKLGIKLNYFLLAIIFWIIAMFCNVMSFRLLIPLINIVINGRVESSFIKEASSQSLFSNKDFYFVAILLAILILTIAKNLLEYFALSISEKQATEARTTLRSQLFDRCLEYEKTFTDQKSLGSLNHVIVRLTDNLSRQIVTTQKILGKFFSVFGYFAILTYLSWKLTIFAIAIIALSHVLSFRISNQLEIRIKNYYRVQNSFADSVVEKLFSILLIKIFNKEKRESGKFHSESREYSNVQLSVNHLENMIPNIRDIIATCGFLAVMFVVPLAESIPTETSQRASELILYFIILRISMPSINAIHDLYLAVMKSKHALGEINRVLVGRAPWTIKDGELEYLGLNDSITITNLNFKFRSRTVLNDINIQIKKGSHYAIIGESGAGKSTLANILFRMYEIEDGKVLVNNVDIKKYSKHSLRDKCAYISQNPHFLNASIYENLIYGLEDADNLANAKLEKVLKQTGLTDLISNLPDGLETNIGLTGTLISGGEKTRLALARALLAEPELIIFDEPLHSLDSISKQKMWNVLKEVSDGITTIHITHDLSHIGYFDQVFVLENGKLVEQGSPKELIDRKQVFYSYWIEQKNAFEI